MSPVMHVALYFDFRRFTIFSERFGFFSNRLIICDKIFIARRGLLGIFQNIRSVYIP